MKKVFLIVFVLTLSFGSKAQLYNWEFGATVGGANYVGDINSSFNSAYGKRHW